MQSSGNNKIIWLTGLSGSGKTTIAHEIKSRVCCIILDGDSLRAGLCSDLGFSLEDRDENIRRVSEVAKLLYSNGYNVVVSFISPMQDQRDFARSLIPEEDFIEVYIATSLETCEERDVKGLYARARSGEIKDFTGINSPYEVPKDPDITIETENLTPKDCALDIITRSEIKHAQ
jgi:adenylylsulfate kinase